MRKTLEILLFLALFQFSIFNFQFSIAHASGFSISPPVIEIRADSPDEVKRNIEITNDSQEKIDLETKFFPFDQNGKLLNIDLPIKSWIAIEDKIALRPKETRNLTLHILIPGAADEADYYFLIAFLSKSKPLAEGISENELRAYSNINAGVSTNVLLSVGQTRDALTNLELTEFLSPKFVQEGPVEFQIKFKNEDRHFAQVLGTILIKNMFGQKVAEIPIPEQNILSQGSRTTSVLFTENFLLGPYNGQIYINNSKTPKEFRFFALPAKKILIASFVILFLVFLKKKLELRFRT